MPLLGQSFDCWYVIGEFEYPCRFHILLVSPCVSIHVFTSDASLFQFPIRMICYPWCIHFEISLLRSIQNWVLGSFRIFIIARASNCWLYATPELVLSVWQYAVTIMFLILFFPHSNINEQWTRLLNSLPVPFSLHDTLSNAMIYVPPFWNGPPEMVTQLYPVLIFLVFNHLSFLLYIFSFMRILLQLLFIASIPIIATPSLIIVFLKVYSLCWLNLYYALSIPPMFCNVILFLPSLPPFLSWWPQSPRQFLLGFVSVFFGIPLWSCPGDCR